MNIRVDHSSCFSFLDIIDYYCLLHDHQKALYYIELINEVGSKVK